LKQKLISDINKPLMRFETLGDEVPLQLENVSALENEVLYAKELFFSAPMEKHKENIGEDVGGNSSISQSIDEISTGNMDSFSSSDEHSQTVSTSGHVPFQNRVRVQQKALKNMGVVEASIKFSAKDTVLVCLKSQHLTALLSAGKKKCRRCKSDFLTHKELVDHIMKCV
jgi:hypothetical protein